MNVIERSRHIRATTRRILDEVSAAELARLASDGLIRLDECGFTVTPRGRLLLRVVAMAFDASFRRPEAAAGRFSSVI